MMYYPLKECIKKEYNENFVGKIYLSAYRNLEQLSFLINLFPEKGYKYFAEVSEHIDGNLICSGIQELNKENNIIEIKHKIKNTISVAEGYTYTEPIYCTNEEKNRPIQNGTSLTVYVTKKDHFGYVHVLFYPDMDYFMSCHKLEASIPREKKLIFTFGSSSPIGWGR